jgi:hypothetical protein
MVQAMTSEFRETFETHPRSCYKMNWFCMTTQDRVHTQPTSRAHDSSDPGTINGTGSN